MITVLWQEPPKYKEPKFEPEVLEARKKQFERGVFWQPVLGAVVDLKC